jgi:phosphohistidine phosphatase
LANGGPNNLQVTRGRWSYDRCNPKRSPSAIGTMNIFILRHAKAEFGSKGEDPPVSKEGKRQANRMLKLAKEDFGFRPNIVVSSPILRAKQTAEIVKKNIGGNLKVVMDDCLSPDSTADDVLGYLSRLKKDDNVVLISHMPLIFELLYDLIGGRGEIELLNGSIAAVQFKGMPESGKGRLVWLLQPET